MSCPFCKRTDTDGLYCDDDHCRELTWPADTSGSPNDYFDGDYRDPEDT